MDAPELTESCAFTRDFDIECFVRECEERAWQRSCIGRAGTKSVVLVCLMVGQRGGAV